MMGRGRQVSGLVGALGRAVTAGAGVQSAVCSRVPAGARGRATSFFAGRSVRDFVSVGSGRVWAGAASGVSSSRRGISTDVLRTTDEFSHRHTGSGEGARGAEVAEMLKTVGFKDLEELVSATVPESIRVRKPLDLGRFSKGQSETEAVADLKAIMSKNIVNRSHIGMGYYGTKTPYVILRNILENPAWYTQYTPYQAEISQGRLESLMNFQTMVSDMTGLPMANASLLDEATAAGEAMTMAFNATRGKKKQFLVSDKVHPQTLSVVRTRARGFGIEVVVTEGTDFKFDPANTCGALVQYPATDGSLDDMPRVIKEAHAAGALVVMATDLLALTKLKSPGELGADIAVGSSQRFGVPMGYGGPHAAFLSTDLKYARQLPGRIMGWTIDAEGDPALRMAMQTREQHIRRDKATSNICTAQALLANMAAMYACYHGPKGLTAIADRTHGLAAVFAEGCRALGHDVGTQPFFDTVRVNGGFEDVIEAAETAGINLRDMGKGTVTVSFDETTTEAHVDELLAIFARGKTAPTVASLAAQVEEAIPASMKRTSSFLEHPAFNSYHTEHELLRYMKKLEGKDLSMVHSMIALGSCTMKLNATAEMIPVTWPETCNMHPFAPASQAKGYEEMLRNITQMLCEVTGFDAMSLQPNAGAQGEYAGLQAISSYHRSRGDHQRKVCLIPLSAHGTNPASAAMAGMSIVPVKIDAKGYVDVEDVKVQAEKYKDTLAALMITYPSTHGVYEEGIKEICDTVHKYGGQVYMDGANMNAQVGLTSPGAIGADVCHLNLHKTFCIPHGGGGPGMGPIGVKKQLAPFLSGHEVVDMGEFAGARAGEAEGVNAVSAAPFGSAAILPISYMFLAMMGSEGLTDATKMAILNANYMAKRLENDYQVLFTGANGTCAHEFIIDTRQFEETAGIKVEDIAKRLIDYGFHAPTMSWPVPGTLMVEPTESETKEELDRFCDAMIAIRAEIREIEEGRIDPANNPLVHAPHSLKVLMAPEWNRPYTREQGAFPTAWVRDNKFWPTISRVDNLYGDRNLKVRNDPVKTEVPIAATV